MMIATPSETIPSAVASLSSSVSADASPSKYYISITSIQVPFSMLSRFGWYSLPIVPQAKRSPGNVLTKTYLRNYINYTLTVWESRQHMLQFLRSGAHGQAMRGERTHGVYGSFAQTYGYPGNDIPDWDEAIAILQEKGRIHYDNRAKDSASTSSWTSNLTYIATTAAALVTCGMMAAKFHATDGGSLVE